MSKKSYSVQKNEKFKELKQNYYKNPNNFVKTKIHDVDHTNFGFFRQWSETSINFRLNDFAWLS